MTSDYRGYYIIHDRNRAQAWKGEYDPTRPPEVDVSPAPDGALAQAVRVIDVLEGADELSFTNLVVPI